MWAAAFVGMATKYGEIVLGILYREKDEKGAYVGGPMYYIRKGLHTPWLATLCAFSMVLLGFVQWRVVRQAVALGLFTIPNLIVMVVLWPKVRQATKEFFGEKTTVTSGSAL